jgi:hypothetical protein
MTKSRTVLFAAVLIGLVSPLAYGQTLKSGPPSELSSPKDVTTRQGPSAGLASLPPEAQAGISAALGRDLPAYQARPQGAGFQAENARQKLAADFTPAGVEVRSGSALCRVALRGYGYGNSLRAVGTAVPRASLNRVEYQRGWLTEWYVNGPLGLEQGFTVNEPPRPAGADTIGPAASGNQPLTIALALSGDLTATVDRGSTGLALRNRDGQAQLRYSGLAAYDATGKELRAWLEMRGERLLLKVEDARARYPVLIDPWVQLAELTASDGQSDDEFAWSVSISGDTVVVGASGPYDGTSPGAAYVFVKPASGWADMTQTAKLTASDGQAGDSLGSSVGISGDTVVAGAPHATIGSYQYEGAAYVFVKPPGGWANMTQTAKLTASFGQEAEGLGDAVAISGDTVAAGASGWDSAGAVYVFVKQANGWRNANETAKLTGSDKTRFFGDAVSVDGNTLVVGDPLDWYEGKVYVYVKPFAGWISMTETAQLTASDESDIDEFSSSVAVSGNAVVAGSPYAVVNDIQKGAAYVFVKPPRGWKTTDHFKAKLTTWDGASQDAFGLSVAIGGNTAVVGAACTVGGNQAQGAAYLYVRPPSGWRTTDRFNAKLTASDGAWESLLGRGVGVSGNMVVAGAPYANGEQGAAYVFGKSH